MKMQWDITPDVGNNVQDPGNALFCYALRILQDVNEQEEDCANKKYCILLIESFRNKMNGIDESTEKTTLNQTSQQMVVWFR